MFCSLQEFCVPFQNEAKLENVDVVDFLNFQNIDDRQGHVDVDRDDCLQHFVETERSDLLVVVVLC